MLEDLCKYRLWISALLQRYSHRGRRLGDVAHTKNRGSLQGKVNIAVVLLQHMSNFTDFNPLEHDERVHLYYTNESSDIADADIIIIPGTKNTLHDLQVLRKEWNCTSILQAHASGKTILGICGGYQMLGKEITRSNRHRERFKTAPRFKSTTHQNRNGRCDILLSPKDLFNIAKKFQITPENALEQYCETYIGSNSRFPVVRLKPQGSVKRCRY